MAPDLIPERLKAVAARSPERQTTAASTTAAVRRYTLSARARLAVQSLLDAYLAAIGTDALLKAGPPADLEDLDPALREAFALAFPSKDITQLAYESPEQWQGEVSAWQGKYFEVLARDRLNAGEQFGPYILEPGQTASLAESLSQPEWDLRIEDADGGTVDTVQLKATESIAYVRGALERYPDVHVVTTADLAEWAYVMPQLDVVDTSVEEMIEPMVELGEALSSTFLDEILKGLLISAAPLLIVGTEVWSVKSGHATVRQAGERTAARFGKLGIAHGVGWGVNTVLPGFGSLASLVARIGIDADQFRRRRLKNIRQRIAESERVIERCAHNRQPSSA